MNQQHGTAHRHPLEISCCYGFLCKQLDRGAQKRDATECQQKVRQLLTVGASRIWPTPERGSLEGKPLHCLGTFKTWHMQMLGTWAGASVEIINVYCNPVDNREAAGNKLLVHVCSVGNDFISQRRCRRLPAGAPWSCWWTGILRNPTKITAGCRQFCQAPARRKACRTAAHAGTPVSTIQCLESDTPAAGVPQGVP